MMGVCLPNESMRAEIVTINQNLLFLSLSVVKKCGLKRATGNQARWSESNRYNKKYLLQGLCKAPFFYEVNIFSSVYAVLFFNFVLNTSFFSSVLVFVRLPKIFEKPFIFGIIACVISVF